MLESNRSHPEQPYATASAADYERIHATDPGQQGEITSPADAETLAGGYPLESVAEPAGTAADTERPQYAHDTTLPILARAEDVDPQALRERLAVVIGSPLLRAHMEAASVLTELGLATPNEQEAQDMFGYAETLYGVILADADPESNVGLTAQRAASLVPLMRMRREHTAPGDMADVAYEAYTQSLGRTLPLVEQHSSVRQTPGHLLQRVTEDSIAALLARNGQVPFLASEREQRIDRGTGGGGQMSSLHILESDGRKLSIRTKFGDKESIGVDLKARLIMVKYLSDVCRPIIRRALAERNWPSKEEEGNVAMRLSREIVNESNGEPLRRIALAPRMHGGHNTINVIDAAERNVFNTIASRRRQHP